MLNYNVNSHFMEKFKSVSIAQSESVICFVAHIRVLAFTQLVLLPAVRLYWRWKNMHITIYVTI